MLILLVIAALVSGLSSIEASPSRDASIDARSYLGLSSADIKVIDAMYQADDLPSISVKIHNVYQKGDVKSFRSMVQLQLYLYYKYTQLGDHNDAYIFNLAYYLYQIQADRLYKRLASNIQQEVQKYIDYMPPSLQYLFFKPSFCLLNRKYKEYIYTTTAIEIDAQRRYVFVWNKPDKVGSNGRWIRQITDNSTEKKLKLKFALKSEQVKMFLYRERNVKALKNLIAAWRPGTEPDHAEWTVELYKNQLIFKQSGHVMCASEDLYNQSRRYVYGYLIDDQDYNEMTPACQWYAKECP